MCVALRISQIYENMFVTLVILYFEKYAHIVVNCFQIFRNQNSRTNKDQSHVIPYFLESGTV